MARALQHLARVVGGRTPRPLGRALRPKSEQAPVVRPPFYCDYGFNIRLGGDAFLNYNCVILDVAEVSIGEGAQIGPAVQIYAADHPRDPAQRRAGFEFGRPVRIGKHAWIGGGAILLPGISIGTTRWSAPAAS